MRNIIELAHTEGEEKKKAELLSRIEVAVCKSHAKSHKFNPIMCSPLSPPPFFFILSFSQLRKCKWITAKAGKFFKIYYYLIFFFNFHSFGCNMLLDIKSFLAEKKKQL